MSSHASNAADLCEQCCLRLCRSCADALASQEECEPGEPEAQVLRGTLTVSRVLSRLEMAEVVFLTDLASWANLCHILLPEVFAASVVPPVTAELPGTVARLGVLEGRADRRQPLLVPGDAQIPDRLGVFAPAPRVDPETGFIQSNGALMPRCHDDEAGRAVPADWDFRPLQGEGRAELPEVSVQQFTAWQAARGLPEPLTTHGRRDHAPAAPAPDAGRHQANGHGGNGHTPEPLRRRSYPGMYTVARPASQLAPAVPEAPRPAIDLPSPAEAPAGRVEAGKGTPEASPPGEPVAQAGQADTPQGTPGPQETVSGTVPAPAQPPVAAVPPLAPCCYWCGASSPLVSDRLAPGLAVPSCAACRSDRLLVLVNGLRNCSEYARRWERAQTEQERDRLRRRWQAQPKTLEALARFEARLRDLDAPERAALLRQVREARARFQGLRKALGLGHRQPRRPAA